MCSVNRRSRQRPKARMNAKEILNYYLARQDEIVDSIREIVEIESPSFDAARSIEVVDWIERRALATSQPFTIERVPADGCGEHILIRAFASDVKGILLLGHTDTVHPVGT